MPFELRGTCGHRLPNTWRAKDGCGKCKKQHAKPLQQLIEEYKTKKPKKNEK